MNSVVMVTWVHQRGQAPRQLLRLPLDPALFLAQLALQLRCAIETLLQMAWVEVTLHVEDHSPEGVPAAHSSRPCGPRSPPARRGGWPTGSSGRSTPRIGP